MATNDPNGYTPDTTDLAPRCDAVPSTSFSIPIQGGACSSSSPLISPRNPAARCPVLFEQELHRQQSLTNNNNNGTATSRTTTCNMSNRYPTPGYSNSSASSSASSIFFSSSSLVSSNPSSVHRQEQNDADPQRSSCASGSCVPTPRKSRPISPLASSPESSRSQSLPDSNSRKKVPDFVPSSCFMIRPMLTETESDGSVRFSVQNYPTDTLAAMNGFRQNGDLCDVTLEMQGERIEAHKLVLASFSCFFRGMFTNGMMEADSKVIKIQETSISAASLRTLIDFAYTQVICINQENVQPLLSASTFFEIRHVIDACTVFLEQQLDPSNCIGICLYAREIGCTELFAYASRYLEEHFCDVMSHDEVLTLETKDFVELLQKDNLYVRCESEVFEAVVRWVNYDLDRRKDKMEMLLKNVRLFNLAPGFLVDKLQKCSLINEIPMCREMLEERLCHLTTTRTCLDKPRVCKPCMIYLVGGFCRKTMEPMNCFECFNPRTKEWTRLPDLPLACSFPGSISLKGLLYVLGGRLRKCNQDFDSCAVNVYDPAENTWYNRSPMSMPRNRVGLTVLDNHVYAVGGRAGGDLFKSAERYNPDQDEWKPIADMRSVRVGPGIAVVNRLLYAVGGVDETCRRLSSVECYHPERNEWKDVAPLKHARSGAGVAVLDNYIYAVGGFDGEHQLRSVERFNVKTGEWEEMAPLPEARSSIQLVAARGQLYILGGFDGSNFQSSVQSYNPKQDTWHSESTMMFKRSGYGVAVAVAPSHLVNS